MSNLLVVSIECQDVKHMETWFHMNPAKFTFFYTQDPVVL
jgi:hypothetical protein